MLFVSHCSLASNIGGNPPLPRVFLETVSKITCILYTPQLVTVTTSTYYSYKLVVIMLLVWKRFQNGQKSLHCKS
jgi:hypothetical protein